MAVRRVQVVLVVPVVTAICSRVRVRTVVLVVLAAQRGPQVLVASDQA